ncbi:MAG: autotransporter-associated beta strand repeat-containing protein, partial [Chlamydiia bacterium]
MTVKKWALYAFWLVMPHLEAVITVTNTNISGPGSLDAAVTSANSSPQTIVFDPSLAGQDFNMPGLLSISNTYTIDGRSIGSVTIRSRGVEILAGSPSLLEVALVTGGDFNNNTSGTTTLQLRNFGGWYSGLNLNNGAITLASSNSLGGGALVFSNGTTLNLNSGVSQINNMTLAGTDTISVASGTGTLQGILSGTGSLTKTGGGILRLSGVNTYTGNTSLSAGAITLGNSSGL